MSFFGSSSNKALSLWSGSTPISAEYFVLVLSCSSNKQLHSRWEKAMYWFLIGLAAVRSGGNVLYAQHIKYPTIFWIFFWRIKIVKPFKYTLMLVGSQEIRNLWNMITIFFINLNQLLFQWYIHGFQVRPSQRQQLYSTHLYAKGSSTQQTNKLFKCKRTSFPFSRRPLFLPGFFFF